MGSVAGWVLNLLVSLLVRVMSDEHNRKMLGKIIMGALEKAASSTTNSVDDELVGLVRQALEKDQAQENPEEK